MLFNRVYFRETTTEVSKISAHTDIDLAVVVEEP